MKITKSIALSAFILIFSMASLGVVADKAYEQGVSDVNVTVKPIIKTVYKEKIVYKNPKGIIAQVSMVDLDNDLKKTYKHLSADDRLTILTAIGKASDKYKINPMVFYGLISVESSFRAYITHNQVVINGKKDNAIGLTGIIPSLWMTKLRKAGIVETKTDLYNPAKNIAASGFILDEYKKAPLKKGTTDATTSALRRFFGGNYKNYSNKIEKGIGKILFSKIYN